MSEVELQNISRIFQQFDKDKSNTIDISELKEVMSSLGVLMNESHLSELVEQVTSDGNDSELNFDQFVSLITLWKEASQYKLFDGSGFKSLAQTHVEQALRTNCFVPDAPARAAWDLVICIAAVIAYIWVLLLDAYTYRSFDAGGLIAGDIIITFVFALDSIICSRTCFVSDVRLVDDPPTVLRAYLTSWAVPDILSAIPFDLVLTASGAHTAAYVLRHLRILKLIKLPFLWQSSGNVPITSHYIQFHFHVLPIFQLALTFVAMVHGFSIGWILMKQSSCDDPTYVDLVSPAVQWAGTTPPFRCYYAYTPAVYFVLYSLSTVGLGDILVKGESEQLYVSFVLLGAMGTNGLVIGKLVALLQRADINKERRSKLRETLAVLDHFHIPRQLQHEILQFQAHVFEHNLGAAYEGIVSGLPQEMRVNISLFVKMKLVTKVPLFVDSHYMLRIAVAQSLENAVARPEQYIIVQGQACDGLYLLAYGFADVFSGDGTYDGTLRSGDFFGEGALIGELQQRNSVKAITYCDLWQLSQVAFSAILFRFPKFKRHVDEKRRVPEKGGNDAFEKSQSNLMRRISGVDEVPLVASVEMLPTEAEDDIKNPLSPPAAASNADAGHWDASASKPGRTDDGVGVRKDLPTTNSSGLGGVPPSPQHVHANGIDRTLQVKNMLATVHANKHRIQQLLQQLDAEDADGPPSEKPDAMTAPPTARQSATQQ